MKIPHPDHVRWNVCYLDRPIPAMPGGWKPYSPDTTNLVEQVAKQRRDELALRFPQWRWCIQPNVHQKPSHFDMATAAGILADRAGLDLPKPQKLTMLETVIALRYCHGVLNHGNRLPEVNGTLNQTARGELRIHLGGAR